MEENLRRSGQTTRLVDKYIQVLFTTGKIEVKDHSNQGSAHLVIGVMMHKRLSVEHNMLGGTITVSVNPGTGIHTFKLAE